VSAIAPTAARSRENPKPRGKKLKDRKPQDRIDRADRESWEEWWEKTIMTAIPERQLEKRLEAIGILPLAFSSRSVGGDFSGGDFFGGNCRRRTLGKKFLGNDSWGVMLEEILRIITVDYP